MAPQSALARQMLERADQDGLPAGHALRRHSQAFEEACMGFYAAKQTTTAKQMLSVWAQARRAWCDYSGEPLV